MKIYVASSWRNAHQAKVVEVLRSAGHEVYDFKNPAPGNEGFSWRQVDPYHRHGEPVTAGRWRRMVDHPVALEGHAHDLGAMKWADACVYVLPCGRSASFEAGWFAGQGKRLVVLAFEPTEPELMFREADIVGSLAGMLDALATLSPETGAPTPADRLCSYCEALRDTGHDSGKCACPHPDDVPRMTLHDTLVAFETIRSMTRVGEAAHGIATLAVQQIKAYGGDGVPVPAATREAGWELNGDMEESQRMAEERMMFRPRCLAPLGDDDTIGPREPGYCDVSEAGEGGRCIGLCAVAPATPAEPGKPVTCEHEYGTTGATIYCIHCDTEWDLVSIMETNPLPRPSCAPAGVWTEEEIERSRKAADGYRDVFPDPAVPAAEPGKPATCTCADDFGPMAPCVPPCPNAKARP